MVNSATSSKRFFNTGAAPRPVEPIDTGAEINQDNKLNTENHPQIEVIPSTLSTETISTLGAESEENLENTIPQEPSPQETPEQETGTTAIVDLTAGETEEKPVEKDATPLTKAANNAEEQFLKEVEQEQITSIA